MADNTDRLIRFLLPQGRCRGAIIRAENIVADAAHLHGLHNDNGKIALTCRYCNTSYEMDAPSA